MKASKFAKRFRHQDKTANTEVEIKKSINDFILNYKKDKNITILRKALGSWRRNQKFASYENDLDAAKEILNNWEAHKESFYQTVFAIRQAEK